MGSGPDHPFGFEGGWGDFSRPPADPTSSLPTRRRPEIRMTVVMTTVGTPPQLRAAAQDSFCGVGAGWVGGGRAKPRCSDSAGAAPTCRFFRPTWRCQSRIYAARALACWTRRRGRKLAEPAGLSMSVHDFGAAALRAGFIESPDGGHLVGSDPLLAGRVS
jgi:hypothetical protein